MTNEAITLLLEPFLAEYYLIDALCASFITKQQQKEIYGELANVFCLPVIPGLEEYYGLSEQEEFRTIKNKQAYERLSRMMDYAAVTGSPMELTAQERVVLAQKREAVTIKAEIFKQSERLTKEALISALLEAAMRGDVEAMAVLSYMEYHGICVCCDKKRALKRIQLAAGWNNLFANLMGIAYDGENKAQYFNTLNSILRGNGRQLMLEHIRSYHSYTAAPERNEEAHIMEKAFALGSAKRNLYCASIGKVLFSKIVSAKDKEKLLVQQGDVTGSLMGIPFDARPQALPAITEDAFADLPIQRQDEIRLLRKNITIAATCPNEVYKPLLISCKDDCVVDMYASALMNMLDSNSCIVTDASLLTYADMAPGKENIFVRSLCTTKNTRTVFFIKHCENMKEEVFNALQKMLNYSYRHSFNLQTPPISLDLSGIMFVLLAYDDGSVVRNIGESCDVLAARMLTEDEKYTVIDAALKERAGIYNLSNAELNDECKSYLCRYRVDDIALIIDEAVREMVFAGQKTVSLQKLKDVCRDKHISCAGNGFGYIGGRTNA